MHVIVRRWEEDSDLHIDYISDYVILLVSKLALNVFVLCYTCSRDYTCWHGISSLSVVLADLVVGMFMVKIWLFGPDDIAVPLCSLLTFTSKTYEALPLPLMGLYLWDLWLEDTCCNNWKASYKVVKNIALTTVLWIIAVLNANRAVKVNLIEQRTAADKKVLLCEVQDATLVTYFALLIFSVSICLMLPYCSWIPQWISEAERMFEAREKHKMKNLVTLNQCARMTPLELMETPMPRPPLWLSLVLGFSTLWMPYVVIITASLLLGFCLPSFIGVNLMWLECTNSVQAGVMFWVKSCTRGPYVRVPTSVCSWEVYWHLSQQSDMKLLSPVLITKNKLYV
ncbi:uncharacterized protein si:dkeyp-100a1.6 [Corythoichthys intestinalis]|uniref:uncharacterized protein si:dkeyp-100a1.6 n=1 Tax=Corythoichthys intestinalis TaxID=161448 RepID=UPI0025A5A3CA|nr:uncharacterized protein si:dkeyp-100a1.6 [Corythoichthys intestinalis]XP_057676406.1 uncharacterized protein si:dkeyp-100a1.6 [Corythoichthys intestinalis]XP_057676417.1 uncharacterized protein si:dkeyp-100a1.6 [Corythoichthys intestinalis]